MKNKKLLASIMVISVLSGVLLYSGKSAALNTSDDSIIVATGDNVQYNVEQVQRGEEQIQWTAEQIGQNADQAQQNADQVEQAADQSQQKTEQSQQTAEQVQQSEEQVQQNADQTQQNALGIPQITSVTIRSKTSFLVKLKRVSGVSGYYIYNINDNGELVKLKKISDNHTNELIVGGLKYKKTFRLTVRAYKKNKKTGEIVLSDYDTVGITKRLKVKSKYKKGLKYYYDMDGKILKDVRGFLPKNSKYIIKVNTEKCVMTIYAKDGKKGYRIPVKSFLCSPGGGTKSGTFSLGAKYRYRSLFYSSYSQWTAVIHGNILFHTTPYTSYGNNNTLDVAEYNKLGTAASHGCVRLQCVAVKWIYDNCPGGTKVIIYKSRNAGPFGKPKLEKLAKWHKWDPTDPTAKKKCAKHNCNHKIY